MAGLQGFSSRTEVSVLSPASQRGENELEAEAVESIPKYGSEAIGQTAATHLKEHHHENRTRQRAERVCECVQSEGECVNVAPVVQFPAFCSHCGLIFDSAFAVENSVGITLKDVRQNCPRCDEWADLPDGTFDVTEETIHVLAAPALTRERLLRLQTILDAAREGRMSDEEAVEAVADEAPELAGLMQRLRPKMGKALVFFLCAAVQILATQMLAEHRSDAATRADVERAVERAVEYCKANPSP